MNIETKMDQIENIDTNAWEHPHNLNIILYNIEHAKSSHIQTPQFDQSTNLNVSKKDEIHASQNALKFYVLIIMQREKAQGSATCSTGSTCGEVNLLVQHILSLSRSDESHKVYVRWKWRPGDDVENAAMTELT